MHWVNIDQQTYRTVLSIRIYSQSICHQFSFTTYFTQYSILQAFVYVDDLEYSINTGNAPIYTMSLRCGLYLVHPIHQIDAHLECALPSKTENIVHFALLILSVGGKTTFLSMINQINVVSFVLGVSLGVMVLIVW